MMTPPQPHRMPVLRHGQLEHRVCAAHGEIPWDTRTPNRDACIGYKHTKHPSVSVSTPMSSRARKPGRRSGHKTYLHRLGAPGGGGPHAILRSLQNKHAMIGFFFSPSAPLPPAPALEPAPPAPAAPDPSAPSSDSASLGTFSLKMPWPAVSPGGTFPCPLLLPLPPLLVPEEVWGCACP